MKKYLIKDLPKGPVVITKEQLLEIPQGGTGDYNSYSTTETKTGGTWIDGKPIYRKVIPVNSNVWTDLGIGVLDNIISAEGTFLRNGQIQKIGEFRLGSGGGEESFENRLIFTTVASGEDSDSVKWSYFSQVGDGQDGSTFISAFSNIILEYTKTTD